MIAPVWLTRRLAGALVVWLLISFMSFSLSTLAPGDPAQMMLLRRTGDVPAEEDVQRLRHELGLDRPFAERYVGWVTAAARGDLGRSYRTGQPVLGELRARFPATLVLALAAFALGLVIAIPLAVVSAAARDSIFDHGARLVALAGVSLPSYLLGYVLMLLFAVTLGMLPVSGAGSARHLVLPALTLALGSAASVTRMLRANLLDELGEDYVRTARAKGLSGLATLMRHALRNALNPVVTLSALRFGRLLGEAVIVETIFAWPGIGRWMVESIYDRDYPAIQGFVLYIATVFVVINIAVDLAYRALDPRVRVGAPLAAGS
ncbi:MAG TPA: nickel ABC transporter permease [Gemmatimonadaceae bacterium]|nr:nickel ABC transporter permease [Gemmatimonadaceae bacterium]